MTLEIRLAKQKDAQKIGLVHVACWHETYTDIVPQKFLDQFNLEERQEFWLNAIKGGAAVFVAVHNCKIVGFANGGENRSPEIDAAGELYTLYVLASHQNQGIGKQLFDAVRGNLLSRGLQPFTVWVFAENPACRFYEKTGGVKTAQKSIDCGGPSFIEVAFIWNDPNVN